MFLDHGAAANLGNLVGDGLIHWAISTGRGIEFIELLAGRGADLRARNSEGLTPFQQASRLGHTAVVKFLLRRDAGDDLSVKEQFIVAPAILTNATRVLAMSTINRMLRARERMQQLFAESEGTEGARGTQFLSQVNRVEREGILLLNAMRWIYMALGAFAAASLVTLLGAVAEQFGNEILMGIVVGAGLLLGFTGVTGLVGGCVNLFHATQLSLANIREEAALIRARQEHQKNASGNQNAG